MTDTISDISGTSELLLIYLKWYGIITKSATLYTHVHYAHNYTPAVAEVKMEVPMFFRPFRVGKISPPPPPPPPHTHTHTQHFVLTS